MPPRRSSTEQFIEDLQSDVTVRREAAVARLRLLGARAVPRLAAFIESGAPARARALALSALEGMSDAQAAKTAHACLDDRDVDVVVAALGVLRGWVVQESGTALLERISAMAIDAARDARIRIAAVDALSDLPDNLVAPIRAQAPPPESAGPPLDNPAPAREWVEAHGRSATLATLHDAIKSFRDAENRAETSGERSEWLRARGVAHSTLAVRGSRIALYDARETFSTARSPLPPGFLEAMARMGDGSCLEPLARAWSATGDAVWRAQLAETARQIVTRSKLGGRNAVLKGIRANWAGFI